MPMLKRPRNPILQTSMKAEISLHPLTVWNYEKYDGTSKCCGQPGAKVAGADAKEERGPTVPEDT